ncbi:CRISPR subtype III-B-associated RAMP protein Cmr1 [Thermoanaerobacter kivui]|uniref:CRISPR subtype III-B-associated RAMP protein Cmr1 n=1 Tax=Thermoanaerobacter kivui TaxID=2325 RepID=A0A097AUM1_THEKI|nr:type III-B CRISPR module RAMP protein Cmr1 [Thermoanaerobacter kivui]AIS53495.1 CRISPR subtype III-B-associated RAMP protein Cmr1 [Thermoanaerobacter kivui]
MRIEATYHISTPMFMGGADNGTNTELRPSSLKGLLRFWFRAVAWPQLGSLKEVFEVENSIFGSTEGQAKFLIKIDDNTLMPNKKQIFNKYTYGLNYLGYGLTEKGIRPYIENGRSFTLSLFLKKSVSEEELKFLKQSLQALGLFGGAGARSRRGFGSLSLVSLRVENNEEWNEPRNVKELKNLLRGFLNKVSRDDTLPPYTAFSSKTRIFVKKGDKDPLALLNEVGMELLRYRSYGRASKDKHVLPWGEKAEQIFADDHDLMLDFLNGKRINRIPRRVVFGLPHNYFFSGKGKVSIEPDSKGQKRRASPLFIHIHKLADGNYVGVLSLIPSQFLPQNVRVEIKRGGQSKIVPVQVNYDVISDFLKRPTLGAKVVWPNE